MPSVMPDMGLVPDKYLMGEEGRKEGRTDCSHEPCTR